MCTFIQAPTESRKAIASMKCTVYIYNSLIGSPLPKRKCLGALALSKNKHYRHVHPPRIDSFLLKPVYHCNDLHASIKWRFCVTSTCRFQSINSEQHKYISTQVHVHILQSRLCLQILTVDTLIMQSDSQS